VLNQVVMRGGLPASPRSLGEFVLLPGVGEQVARLKDAGYTIVVVTNQPDVARGHLSEQELEAMHVALAEAAPVDEIVACPHGDRHQCGCRKPKPGMLTEAAARLDIDLGASWLVGDGFKDMGAAHAAGVKAILIEAEYNLEVQAPVRAPDLASAIDHILEQG